MLLLVSSCQFSETIYINNDGSGKMSFNLDGSQLMQMGGDQMVNPNEKVIDSTVVFKDFLEKNKDSIATLPAEEQQRLKALENFNMHMLIDPKTKKMSVDLFTDFKNVDGLHDMFKMMNNAGALNQKNDDKKPNPFSNLGTGESSKVDYSFNGKVFKRSVTITDPEQLAKVKDSIGDAEMMLSASTYTINYHFPKKIKSVSLEDASFSEDHKSFSAEVSFKDYLIDPKRLDVEVILED